MSFSTRIIGCKLAILLVCLMPMLAKSAPCVAARTEQFAYWAERRCNNPSPFFTVHHHYSCSTNNGVPDDCERCIAWISHPPNLSSYPCTNTDSSYSGGCGAKGEITRVRGLEIYFKPCKDPPRRTGGHAGRKFAKPFSRQPKLSNGPLRPITSSCSMKKK